MIPNMLQVTQLIANNSRLTFFNFFYFHVSFSFNNYFGTNFLARYQNETIFSSISTTFKEFNNNNKWAITFSKENHLICNILNVVLLFQKCFDNWVHLSSSGDRTMEMDKLCFMELFGTRYVLVNEEKKNNVNENFEITF